MIWIDNHKQPLLKRARLATTFLIIQMRSFLFSKPSRWLRLAALFVGALLALLLFPSCALFSGTPGQAGTYLSSSAIASDITNGGLIAKALLSQTEITNLGQIKTAAQQVSTGALPITALQAIIQKLAPTSSKTFNAVLLAVAIALGQVETAYPNQTAVVEQYAGAVYTGLSNAGY